jgi:hypothetical protein
MDDGVAERLDRLQQTVESLRLRANGPPENRKYSYSDSHNELGFRLVSGRDPAGMTEEEKAAISPVSARTIRSLLSDDDCPLYRIKVKGSAFVTEQAVRQYERYIAEGDAPSYMSPTPR